MNWKDLKPEIVKADKQIKQSDNFRFYNNVKRRYWQGFKHGIGIAYKIFKTQSIHTNCKSEVLNMQNVISCFLREKAKEYPPLNESEIAISIDYDDDGEYLQLMNLNDPFQAIEKIK